MTTRIILEEKFQRKLPTNLLYIERLNQEFALIEQFQFTRVFLQVQKIIQLMKRLGIPHIIRGSSGSSLVCFLLGITDIDPILYSLELARFMNRGRKDLPDIDIDVPYNRREELYKAIHTTWPGAVARISNHVTYGAKTALREAAKDTLNEYLPARDLRDTDERKAVQSLNRKFFRLEKIIVDEEIRKEIYSEAKKKEGTLKNYSLHCGGIVIFEEEGKIPSGLLLEGHQQQIHLNKDEAEDAGLIKIDILSNRGLAQVIDAQPNPRRLLDYPGRDPATEKLLIEGDTIGLTFGESRGIRKILIELRPRHREDIAIALALIRPAAAAGGRKSSFLERWRHGAEDCVDPLYKPIIFDDDAITRICSILQCSVDEADKWRKAFAKQNTNLILDFRIAVSKKGFPRAFIDCLIDDLNQLALYSFCKSHAISYAQLVWALAYEKAHNPHRFWVATINHCHSEYRKWVHWREAKCAGLRLTREKGHTYSLGKRNGEPAILAKDKAGNTIPEQQRIDVLFMKSIDKDYLDFKNVGYWLGDDFLEGCGVWPLGDPSQQKLDKWFLGSAKKAYEQEVRFCGLIATSRCIRQNGSEMTFISIGVGNRRYVDITIPDKSRYDLFSNAMVEGTGVYSIEGPIELISVKTIHGKSIPNGKQKSIKPK